MEMKVEAKADVDHERISNCNESADGEIEEQTPEPDVNVIWPKNQ